MKIAISPCPNDTFLFYAWIHNLVGQEIPIDPLFADIQELNLLALKKTFSLTKLSFPCFAKLTHAYQLLPVGAALGFHCGPKIIASKAFPLNELSSKIIALPGTETTAHFLLKRLVPPPKRKVFCSYHEIPHKILTGQADCGLIIHESRFTFAKAGCVEIADLGEIWHQHTQLPLPLGGIAIAKGLPRTEKNTIVAILRDSLNYVSNLTDEALPFILKYSQEKEAKVVEKHIATYVNKETEQLSLKGIQAIETLLEGRLPKDWLYEE